MSSRPSAGPVAHRDQALDDSLLKCSCKRIWVIRIQSFASRANLHSCTLLLTAESAAFSREYLSSLSEVHLISSTKDEVAETELCQSFAFLVIVPLLLQPRPTLPLTEPYLQPPRRHRRVPAWSRRCPMSQIFGSSQIQSESQCPT